MIITKFIEINIERRNITFYRKLGYNLKIHTTLIIPVEQLMKGAKNKIVVSCDICHKNYSVTYKDYLRSNKKQNFDTCNKCKFEKSKITNNIKYGCDSSLENVNIKEKYFKTNNERYGGNSSSCCKEILDKQRITRIKRGMEVPSDKPISEFKKYRNRVDHLTRKCKNRLFDEWDGFDYYDGEYIKNNIYLKHTDRLAPTIEHKITVFDGYMNNIPEKEIAKFENLAITKRSINSSRKNKNFELFKSDFL